jgi:hypothetical protein
MWIGLTNHPKVPVEKKGRTRSSRLRGILFSVPQHRPIRKPDDRFVRGFGGSSWSSCSESSMRSDSSLHLGGSPTPIHQSKANPGRDVMPGIRRRVVVQGLYFVGVGGR